MPAAGCGRPNFGNFFAATQAAWYPMGVAAGKMTKSNTLGFVAGVPIGYVIGNINALRARRPLGQPKGQVRVVVTGAGPTRRRRRQRPAR